MAIELIEKNENVWYFHVRSKGNNKILAHSEDYSSRQKAEQGIDALYDAVLNESVKVFSRGKEVK